jgi:hypothetical protein
MALDVYRGCTRAEKREMLGVYWHRGVEASPRILAAAREYGPWAVVCCIVVVAELALDAAFLFGRVDGLAWLAVLAAGGSALATWWAAVRWRELAPLRHAG